LAHHRRVWGPKAQSHGWRRESGQEFTITGKDFGKRDSASDVKCGAAKVSKYVSWSATRIKCKVPAKAKFGKLKVTVVTADGASNSKTFTVKR